MHWGYLSRPRDFWRRQTQLLQSPQFSFVQSLGWFSSVFQALSLARNIPLVLADLPQSHGSITQLLSKRATAQIYFPSAKSENGPVPKSQGFQLVCLADMVAGSGALEALWAFSMVRLAGWPCTLWMVGEGPLLEEYRQFARLASVPEGIHFLPHFRSYPNLPVDPDLLLIPKRAFPWESFDRLFDQHPKITAQTQVTVGPSTSTISCSAISWKPHLLCRAILERFESLGTAKNQSPTPYSRQNFPQLMAALASYVGPQTPGQSP